MLVAPRARLFDGTYDSTVGAITCAIILAVAKKAERAVETLRVPRDMVPLIQREADKAGVSKNEWMSLVLAAAVGYRLPKGSGVLLALSEEEARAYWLGAGNSADDIEEIVGDDSAPAFKRAHTKLAKALPKK